MTQTQATKPAYTGNLFWKETAKGSGVYEPMDVRIIAAHPEGTNRLGRGWLQTRTHMHMYDSAGRRRAFVYECPRKGNIGTYAEAIPCKACDEVNARFKSTGPVNSRFWVWAIDEADNNKLKSLEVAYSVYKAVLEATEDKDLDSYAVGGQLYTVPLRIKRSGVGLNTSYTVSARKQVPFTDVDLRNILNAQGFERTPDLIADYAARSYPPITRLNEEQLARLNNEGLLPFQNENGPGHEALSGEYEAFELPTEPLVSAAAVGAGVINATQVNTASLDPGHVAPQPVTTATQAIAQAEATAAPVLDVASDTLPAFDDSLVNAPRQDVYEGSIETKPAPVPVAGDLF